MAFGYVGVLLISAILLGILAALAHKRSVPGSQIVMVCVLTVIVIFVAPLLLDLITDGRAAGYETSPWIAMVAVAASFIWVLRRPPSRRAPPPARPAARVRRPAAKPEPAPQSRPQPAPGPIPKPPTIFISYRREDSADVTGRLYDRLATEFGRQNVFKDVDSIPLGVDFREHINKLVGTCDVLLAVIGRHWLTVTGSDATRRLDDERDPVRMEIAAALNRNIPVVPLLVSGGTVPQPGALPEDITNLAFRNGTVVRPDPDFHKDVDRLIAGLRGD